MLRPFRILRPASLGEAAAELHRLGEQARVYAGGAELVLLMRHGLLEPDVLVDIKRIPALDTIEPDRGLVRIGATATHRQIERSDLIRERLPMLAQAASTIGNVRVRHQGTLGGNLCFADPHADPATPLLVYEASVRLAGRDGARDLPLDEFLVGTYETAIAPDEVLAEVRVAPLPAGFGEAFLRIERYHRPTINVAAAARCTDGRIETARLALGCIGPKAMRLDELESRVRGLTTSEAAREITASKPYLEERLEPVDDGLGSAAYKLHLACTLLARGLAQAVERAAAGQGDRGAL